MICEGDGVEVVEVDTVLLFDDLEEAGAAAVTVTFVAVWILMFRFVGQ